MTADDQAHIDKVKTNLGKLVEGEVVRDPKNGNAALWNRYICSARFQVALPQLVSSAYSAIWCDRRRQQIRVFGSDKERAATIKKVLNHCAETLNETLSVPIAEQEFQYLLLQGRSTIDAITSSTKVRKVSVDIKIELC
jgi:hypothetical protein